jgi:hypothetical protein
LIRSHGAKKDPVLHFLFYASTPPTASSSAMSWTAPRPLSFRMGSKRHANRVFGDRVCGFFLLGDSLSPHIYVYMGSGSVFCVFFGRIFISLPVSRANLGPLPPPDQPPAGTVAVGSRAAATRSVIAAFPTMSHLNAPICEWWPSPKRGQVVASRSWRSIGCNSSRRSH